MNAVELLDDCLASKIILTGHRDRLEIDAPEAALTPELLAQLQAHKPQLLEILNSDASVNGCDLPTPAPQSGPSGDLKAEWIERPRLDERLVIERAGTGPGWDDAIEPPAPCDGCGGIVRWIDAAGGLHCPTCNPPRTADRLRRLAKELRARYQLRG